MKSSSSGHKSERLMAKVVATFPQYFVLPKQAPSPFVSVTNSGILQSANVSSNVNNPMVHDRREAAGGPSELNHPPRADIMNTGVALVNPITSPANRHRAHRPSRASDETPLSGHPSGNDGAADGGVDTRPNSRSSSTGAATLVATSDDGEGSSSASISTSTKVMPGEERLEVYEFIKVLGRGAEGTAYLVKVLNGDGPPSVHGSLTINGTTSSSSSGSAKSSSSNTSATATASGATDPAHYRVAKVMEISPSGDRDVKKAIDRARSEAMCLDQMSEQFVSVLHFYGSCEGTCYDPENDETVTIIVLVLEYCDASDLRQEIKSRMGNPARGIPRRPFTEREALLLFIQVVLAVARIHSMKMMHRDLKTGNIFLLQNGLLKVGDFGFAREMDDSGTGSLTMCGTPQMMAPEIWANKRYNHKVDIWALGVVLFEMLTLERPFDGENIPEVERNVLSAEPKQLPPTVSAEAHELMTMMLRKDPRARPTAADLLRTPLLRAMLASFEMNAQYLGAHASAVYKAVSWARDYAANAHGTMVAPGNASSNSSGNPRAHGTNTVIHVGAIVEAGLRPHPPSNAESGAAEHGPLTEDGCGTARFDIASASIGSIILREQPQGAPSSHPLCTRAAPAAGAGTMKKLSVLHEGWAMKLSSGAQEWKRRFFRLILDGESWRYFLLMTLNEDVEDAAGISSDARIVAQSTAALPLSFVDDVFGVPSTFLKNSKNSLWIHSMRYPKFFMKCDNPVEAAKWIDVLRAALLDEAGGDLHSSK